MKSVICCLSVFFLLVCNSYAVEVRWDEYTYEGPTRVLQILGTHDYPATPDSEWTIIHDSVSTSETKVSVPIPTKTTTYSARAMVVDLPEGDPNKYSGLSDITPACVYTVDVIEPEDSPPPEPIIITEPEPVDPEPVPIETVDPEPEIAPVEDVEVFTLGLIRLVDCRSTQDEHEIKLCGEDNSDPYLMIESSTKVSKYIVQTDTIEFVEPYENNELFYNLSNLPYRMNDIIINSDDDSIQFVIRKSIELEGVKYEIMVGDDDRFIDPLVIYMPVPEQNSGGGGCFIGTMF
jgi:hypothetical protein